MDRSRFQKLQRRAAVHRQQAHPLPRLFVTHILTRSLAASIGGFVVLPAPAHAQAAQAVNVYHISPGPLTQALNRFGRDAGILLSFSSEQTKGLQTRGIDGSYSVADALGVLLAGTNLEAARQENGSYLLHVVPTQAGVSVLPSVTVQGVAETATGPVQGYVATRSATGTKSDTPLSETPQTLNVVTRDEMDARNVLTLSDALAYTPGVQAGWSGYELRQDVVLIRGFNGNYASYQDGLRSLTGEYVIPRLDPWGAERVEVLKGPASVLYGSNTPGGLINYVSKRPTSEPQREVSVQYGSHDYKQAGIDVSGPVDEDGKVAYRLVASLRDTGSEVRHTGERRQFLAPSLTLRPDADTTLTLMAQYQRDKIQGWTGYFWPIQGTLWTNPNGKLDPRTFPGEPGLDHWDVERTNIGYELEHRFNETWSFSQVVRYTHIGFDAANSFLGGWADDTMRLVNRGYTGWDESIKGLQLDQRIQAKFSTGHVQHTALVGVDIRRVNGDYRYDQGDLGPLDLYDPVYGQKASDIYSPTKTESRTRQTGLYFQDQLKWDQWALSLSARHDWASLDQTGVNFGSTVDTHTRDRVWTGRAGLIYLAENGLAPYVSWSTSFEPATGRTKEGEAFKPTKGRQVEAGVRYQPVGTMSSITLSAFDVTQTNVTAADPADVNFSRQVGEIRVRGVELEGKMQLGRQWGVIASLALLDPEVAKNTPDWSGTNIEGNRPSNVPRQQASLWVDYSPTDIVQGLRIGLGVRYRGSTYGDDYNRIRMPSLALWDGRISYDLGAAAPSLRGLTAAVSASNLFDKQYVGSCGSETACYWGGGRMIYGSLNYRW